MGDSVATAIIIAFRICILIFMAFCVCLVFWSVFESIKYKDRNKQEAEKVEEWIRERERK